MVQRIAEDLVGRLVRPARPRPGIPDPRPGDAHALAGEHQRLRLATQVRSNLFGVVYVLDEPSAGLHPADTEALLRALDRLKAAGNSLFVVEHDLDVIRRPTGSSTSARGPGSTAARCSTAGRPPGSKRSRGPRPVATCFADEGVPARTPRTPKGWLRLVDVTRNNLDHLDVAFPLGVFTSVTGVSGSGKSSLVSQVLVELVAEALGQATPTDEEDARRGPELAGVATLGGRIESGSEAIRRLVTVDQKPIGRTPRSNLATYTGLFDPVRKLFAATPEAKARRYDAGRFSFNVAQGRCETCHGEGFVMVELLFLPSVYAPCPACHGSRYNEATLEIHYRDRSIADVLGMTVDEAWAFFARPRPCSGRSTCSGSRPRLPPARPVGHRTFRRRGPADQARHRTPAR